LLEDEEKEWEFCFILNFFLRGENQYNDQPYQRMLKQVKNVL